MDLSSCSCMSDVSMQRSSTERSDEDYAEPQRPPAKLTRRSSAEAKSDPSATAAEAAQEEAGPPLSCCLSALNLFLSVFVSNYRMHSIVVLHTFVSDSNRETRSTESRKQTSQYATLAAASASCH